MKRMRIPSGKHGFTLVEIIVSMAVLGIVAVVFISLFTGAMVWIYGAGDKGVAINDAQQDVEQRIALQEAEDTGDLILDFPDIDPIAIPGGLVDTVQAEKDRTSSVQAFIPYVPTAELGTMVQSEGSVSFTMELHGKNTQFGTDTYIELYDLEGVHRLRTITSASVTVTSETEASFPMPMDIADFNSSQGAYVVRVITPGAGEDPDEIVRSKFTITLPYRLTAGVQSVEVTGDGTNWVSRSDVTGFPAFTALYGVAYDGNSYVAVGAGGRILFTRYMAPWVSMTVAGGADLRDAAWSTFHGAYYAVGDQGVILKSANALNWTLSASGTTEVLRGITVGTTIDSEGYPEDSLLFAVAETGAILRSADGLTWQEYIAAPTAGGGLFHGIAASLDTRVAVGDDGWVIRENGGTVTADQVLPGTDLTRVRYDAGQDRFLAVGTDGYLLSSADGITWTSQQLTTATLNDLFVKLGEYTIVGDDGTILRSTDGVNWSSVGSNTTEDHLYAVAG